MTPEVRELLDSLLSRLQTVLGDRLVGLYLYGSLVMGDFDPDISDVDLMAATSGVLNDSQLRALDEMHRQIMSERPRWNGRIEIAYISLDALRTFKTKASQIAIISPGEPFHFKEAGEDWLINWYLVREKGITLYGPPPHEIIEPMTKDEYVQAVREQAFAWRDWIEGDFDRPYQGYAIITLCRALYTHVHGEQVSKQAAAQWAKGQLPEWSWLIDEAVRWREAAVEDSTKIDHAATMPITRRFVNDVIDRIWG